MIFKASREKMERCLSIAKSITSSKPQMSILTNILLESENGRIIVTATDLEVGICSSFEAIIDEPGSTTINASKLLGAIIQLPHEDIQVEADQNNNFKIRSLNPKIKAQFTLKGLSRESFPQFPTLSDDIPFFTVPQAILKEMIKKTIFAISTETSRQYLNGVYFESIISEDGKGILRLVSTDGRRLALIDRPCDFTDNVSIDMIVPQKVLTELSHTLNNEGVVKVAFSENQIFFSFDNIIYASSIIDGNFPNYDQVIPKKQESTLQVEREAFTNVLNRSSLLTDEKQNNQVRFSFSPEHAVVSVNNVDAGSYRDELTVEYTGEPLDIAFNIKYLKDYLKEITSEHIEMEMNTPLSPVTLRIEDDGDYVHVIMPMKV
jgi:DNA polymerase-3 subunit beta